MLRPRDSRAFFFLLSIVVAASLALLTYVAYGEAQRTYPKFQQDKLAAQGETIQGSIEAMLRAGVPVRQVIGFDTLARRLMEADATIDHIALIDPEGAPVFRSRRPGAVAVPGRLSPSVLPSKEAGTAFLDDQHHYRVVLPLNSKFETLGYLVLAMPRGIVRQAVDSRFLPLIPLGLLLIAGYGLLVLIAQRGEEQRLRRRLNLGYAAAFLGMGVAVVVAMVALYSEGVQGKTKALANALGQRVGQVFDLGLALDDFEGVDRMLAAYHELNPEISEISLIVDGQVVLGTAKSASGGQWQSDPANYEYVVMLEGEQSSRAEVRLVVGIPTLVVVAEIARSVKNFAVLFVASALLAHLFLQFAQARRAGARRAQSLSPGEATPGSAGGTVEQDGQALAVIPPFFFLAVFVEGLNISFLPRLLEDVVAAAGAAETTASLLFMAYFLSFAIALLPAGRFAERYGPRSLLVGGALAAALGLVLMIKADSLEAVTIARILSGAGQGALFIGVQSFILLASPPGQRTRGAALIVYGFNGGMISGSAIGALLVNYIGSAGVFAAAGMIAVSIALYAELLVPNFKAQAASPKAPARPSLLAGMGRLVKDWGFVKAILFVGMPAKAVLTGVTMFALPLTLSRAEVAQEDIGLIIMLYAGAVLIASRYVSNMVDRLGQTGPVLFIGAALSAIALMAMGFGNRETLDASFAIPFLGLGTIIASTIVLGLAQGFINAPVVTHVANTKGALALGQSTATSIYRLAERFGHVAGPLVVGQVMLLSGQDPMAIAYVGLAVGLAAMFFLIGRRQPSPAETSREGQAA